MTTDKQTDHYRQYKNVETISGDGIKGYCRIVAQNRRGKWILFEASMLWGGRLTKGKRMLDRSGRLLSFDTKEQAVKYSEQTK